MDILADLREHEGDQLQVPALGGANVERAGLLIHPKKSKHLECCKNTASVLKYVPYFPQLLA